MDWAQLIEKAEREARDLVGMVGVVIHFLAEPARASDQFVGAPFFFGRLQRDGILLGDEIEQDAFADADTGNKERLNIEPLREREKNESGDAHHFGAILSDAIRAHAAWNVKREQAPALIAKQAHVHARDAFDERTGRKTHERFGVATAADRNRACKFRRRGNRTAAEREDVMADARGLLFVNRAAHIKLFHEANRAQRQADAVLEIVAVIKIQLEAATAEIEDDARLKTRAERPKNGGAHQPRFFFSADHFEFNAGLALDARHEAAIVARFARGRG